MTLDVEGFNAWMTAIAAVIVVLSWLWRKALVHAWTATIAAVAGLLHMIDRFPNLLADVSYVKHEVKYNGGSTNKDMTRRLVHAVDYLLGEANIATFTTDANGLVKGVSERAFERLKCQRQELLGLGWKSFLHPDGAAKIIEQWDEAVREGRNLHVNGLHLKTHTDELRVDVEVIALRGNDGEFSGHIGYIRKSALP